jgi:hypothetical protein
MCMICETARRARQRQQARTADCNPPCVSVDGSTAADCHPPCVRFDGATAADCNPPYGPVTSMAAMPA